MASLTVRALHVRRTATIVATSLGLAACNSDTMTSTSYNECASEPGCQVMSAAVAPEVIQALDDANLRVTSSMQPQTRALVEAQLDRLKTALTRRDLVNGRLAFAAVISAVSRAERANSSARPDLGALRLNLVPTARSLGLPVSDTEAETP